jgi:hypothetical protein
MSEEKKQPVYVVFDVESVGLHGTGFAVGWVVIDREGRVLDKGLAACLPSDSMGTRQNLHWVRENIPHLPVSESGPTAVRNAFWQVWDVWRERGAVLVADCPWPVEARFLAACVDDEPAAREWRGPYPFIDVASVRLAAGLEPLAQEVRLEEELPVHNPLADAMQSARLFLEALDELATRPEAAPAPKRSKRRSEPAPDVVRVEPVGQGGE